MKFEGIMPALVTPLRADESINTEVLERLIKYFDGKGACGFYVGGATGEGIALRTEERMVLAEAAVASTDKPCIIQVAATDYNDAIALAKAQGKGAIALRGKMIDAPIVARAERTVEMAKALGMDRREEV